jgi:hypothetical protein
VREPGYTSALAIAVRWGHVAQLDWDREASGTRGAMIIFDRHVAGIAGLPLARSSQVLLDSRF